MVGRPLILCVDERREALFVRKMLLEQFGCDVVTADDAHQGLIAATHQKIDLVIIDYHLTVAGNGEHLARDLRACRPGLPLIMLTGDPTVPESAKSSVDATLIKGFIDPSDLLATIQKLLPGASVRQPRRVSQRTA